MVERWLSDAVHRSGQCRGTTKAEVSVLHIEDGILGIRGSHCCGEFALWTGLRHPSADRAGS